MRTSLHLLPFLLCATAAVWFVQNDPFFWDTVQLGSKHAHHFYLNGLHWTPLPPDIDSGHPPLFGWYLACVWAVFGKSLPASHWAMLPFILLNIWLTYRLGRLLAGNTMAFWLVPLVLLDPVVAGQHVLISPDVVLISFFLLSVCGMLERQPALVAIGVLGLCAVSMRGMMTAGALFVGQMVWQLRTPAFNVRYLTQAAGACLRAALPFLPGFLFALWFLWWHLNTAGWIGYHPGSPWAPTFEKAGPAHMARNLGIVGWRWLDFGRVFVWLLLAWLLWRSRPASVFSDPLFRRILLLLACLVFFLTPSAVLLKNVSAHRYALPGFLALTLLTFRLTAISGMKARKTALTLLIVALALGNRWIYPRGIAMGWDATLAHLPYHELRAEALRYLDEEKIAFQSIGSAFPNVNTGENLLLNGDGRRFSEKDFVKNRYVMASNVYNDFSEEDYAVLGNGDWALLKRMEKAGVWIEIYRRVK